MSFTEFLGTLGIFSLTGGQFIMIVIGLVLLYLAINKKFEPLLLLPIGFGALLTNIPEIGLSLSPIEKLIYADNLEHINNILLYAVLCTCNKINVGFHFLMSQN